MLLEQNGDEALDNEMDLGFQKSTGGSCNCKLAGQNAAFR